MSCQDVLRLPRTLVMSVVDHQEAVNHRLRTTDIGRHNKSNNDSECHQLRIN